MLTTSLAGWAENRADENKDACQGQVGQLDELERRCDGILLFAYFCKVYLKKDSPLFFFCFNGSCYTGRHYAVNLKVVLTSAYP